MNNENWRDTLLKRIREAPSNIVIVKDLGNFLDDPLFFNNLKTVATLCKCSSDLEIFKEINSFEDENSKLIIILDPKKSVPYAIDQKAAELGLTASMLFPLLNPDILSECGVETYDALFVHYQRQKELFTTLSRQRSKEFIIQAVFDLNLSNMDLESVVSFFAHLYLKRCKIPSELIGDVREIAKEYGVSLGIDFFKLPFAEDQLWNWISEQWNAYVAGSGNLLNFDNPVLLAILPNLLNSSVLKKTKVSELQTLKSLVKARPLSVLGVDFQIADEQDIIPLIETKLLLIEGLVTESKKLSPELWLNIAKQWGQIRYLQFLGNLSNRAEKLINHIEKLSYNLEKDFQKFLFEEYDRIVISSTSIGPQTVDKILHYISNRQLVNQKSALVVFDGMGMAEWEIIRNYLENNSVPIKSEKQIFAMLPTLTNYSRQAIFSGKQPNEFADTIKGLREKSFFVDFWKSKGYRENDVWFAHIVPDRGMLTAPSGELLQALEEGTKILGLAFAFIDNRLHEPYDLNVGKRLFHRNIQNFLHESCLADIFHLLIEKGYRVYITSDHGNIVGIGNGITDSKGLAERQGKRCLIYDRKILAEERQKTTDCSLLSSRFVPTNNFILFANGTSFFGQIGLREITHGGISVEESVVPLIEV